MLRFRADFKGGNDRACERKASEFHGGWVERKRERRKEKKFAKKKGRNRAEKKNGGGKMRAGGERVRRHCVEKVQLDCFSQRIWCIKERGRKGEEGSEILKRNFTSIDRYPFSSLSSSENISIFYYLWTRSYLRLEILVPIIINSSCFRIIITRKLLILSSNFY